VGVQQRVEIIKALVRNARVLILDEPTAVLTPQETDELIGIMRQLKSAGTSIVFITHKLREVRAIADSITVIRRGKVIGQAQPSTSETELASMMVGRAVSLTIDKAPATPGEAVFTVDNLAVVDDRGQTVVDDVSFDVHAGEILVIAGVQGNGQTELTEAIVGLHSGVIGSIRLDGEELVGRNVRQVLDAGVGFVPEDRALDGIIGSFSVAENLVLDRYVAKPFASGLSLRGSLVRENADQRVEEYDIRTPSVTATADTLSGGNQQKLVIARELSRPLKLLIASQPTRGLDVGSIEFVHARIVQERDHGTPVVIVSNELDEVSALADRVAVMYRGRIIGIVDGGTDRDVLGLMMAGVPKAEAQAHASAHPTAAEHPDEVVVDGTAGDPVERAETQDGATP
jgi:simple sugar transport system ATP-binding protein